MTSPYSKQLNVFESTIKKIEKDIQEVQEEQKAISVQLQERDADSPQDLKILLNT